MDFLWNFIFDYGIAIILILIILEYSCFPLPSEIILPITGAFTLIKNYNIFFIIFLSVIAGIIGLALTVGAFYFILKKRAKTLATIYPDDKFIVLKETVACIGMVFGSILLLYAVMFSIFLPFLRKRD